MAEALKKTAVDDEAESAAPHLEGLLRMLRRFDARLERAVHSMRASGRNGAADSFRGLYISDDDAAHLLAHTPCASPLRPRGEESQSIYAEAPGDVPRLSWLMRAFSLSPFDCDIMLVALAPELDLRYERLYAYLQDDLARRRPSVDFALNLLCASPVERLQRRAHFNPRAPLFRHELMRLHDDPRASHPSLLSCSLKLDEQIIRLLVGQESLDARLAPFGDLVAPRPGLEELPLREELKTALPSLLLRARVAGRPLRFYFHGQQGAGKRRTAEALAAQVGATLLILDLRQVIEAGADFPQTLRLALREAWFHDAVLYLEGFELLRETTNAARLEWLIDALTEDGGVVILSGTRPWVPVGRAPTGILSVEFETPDYTMRRACWQSELASSGITIEGRDLDALAGRFRLSPQQISEAVGAAGGLARLHAAGHEASGAVDDSAEETPSVRALFTAARMQSSQDLSSLALKIDPTYTWNDIVLPEDTVAQLLEICRRVAHQQKVFGEWGFDGKLSTGRGVNALFAGLSGTGKTMAAEVIANELELDLYKIDLSGVVSKYIGETEKNLDRIFRAAENANAILFFDEADALFGKRSEVRDAHDRYANIEVAYLLQKMEQFDGVAILATNLRGNLDDAFLRRLAFIIHFPFPDEEDRLRIWRSIWPERVPLADEVNLDFFARQFNLSGGNVKNIALAATFLAAEEDCPVGMSHLFHATQREYQKLGKALSEFELYGACDTAQSAGWSTR